MGQKPLDRKPTWDAILTCAKLGCGFLMLGRGKFTLVDEDLMDALSEWNWRDNDNGYVIGAPRGSKRNQYLHRMLANATDGVEIDHINRIRYDNRLENLRTCTTSQNRGNTERHSDNSTSKFKGVRKRSDRRKWDARGNSNYRTIYLGTFDTEEDAARAYDDWAFEKWGVFARLNFPRGQAI